MNEAPQSAVPACSTNPTSILSHAPGAQAVADVLTIAAVSPRASGFPIYARLAAMVSRYERRGFPLFTFDRPPARYQRLRDALHTAWAAPYPARRTRLMGTSLRMDMQLDHDYHDAILDALGYSCCPGACTLCRERAATKADEWAYEHERDARVLAGGAR